MRKKQREKVSKEMEKRHLCKKEKEEKPRWTTGLKGFPKKISM
ncbi:MAG: hypothetical protein ACOX7X_05220 [Methanosarcina flavescens]